MSAAKKPVRAIDLDDEVETIGAIAAILKALATTHISCGEVIEGTVVDWLSQRLDEVGNRVADAADAARGRA